MPGTAIAKWLITAPAGLAVDFPFTEIDTDTALDLVYAFDGAGSHAKFVGISAGPIRRRKSWFPLKNLSIAFFHLIGKLVFKSGLASVGGGGKDGR